MDARISHFIASDPSNNICADCGQKGTRWVSITYGSFLCIKCGGIHRKLGTHISRIKSLYLDVLSDEQIQASLLRIVSQGGNQNINRKLNRLDIPPPAIPLNCNQKEEEVEMEEYIRDKYERRLFQGESVTCERDDQLQVLQEMGFTDQSQCQNALRRTGGDLLSTIEILAETKAVRESPSTYCDENLTENSTSTSLLSVQSPADGISQHKLEEMIKVLEGMGFKNRGIRNPDNLADSFLGSLIIYNNFSIESTINELVGSLNESQLAPSPPLDGASVSQSPVRDKLSPVLPVRPELPSPSPAIFEEPRVSASSTFTTSQRRTPSAIKHHPGFGRDKVLFATRRDSKEFGDFISATLTSPRAKPGALDKEPLIRGKEHQKPLAAENKAPLEPSVEIMENSQVGGTSPNLTAMQIEMSPSLPQTDNHQNDINRRQLEEGAADDPFAELLRL